MRSHSLMRSILPFASLLGLSYFLSPDLQAQQVQTLSVTPSSPNTDNVIFKFAYSDSSGYGNIAETHFIIWDTSNPEGLPQCQGYWAQNVNGIYLMNAAENAWLGPVALGTSQTVTNGICTVNAVGSSVAPSGADELDFTVSLTAQNSFAGTKGVSIMAAEVNYIQWSGWSQLGTWTVPASQTVISIDAPSSGSVMTGTSYTASGFAIDSSVLVSSLQLSGAISGTATYGSYLRPDVCSASPYSTWPPCNNNTTGVGWTYSGINATGIDTTQLTPGPGQTVTATATLSDNRTPPPTGQSTGVVVDQPPSVTTTVPQTGNSFTFTVSSWSGQQNIKWINALINTSLTLDKSCEFSFWPTSPTAGLMLQLEEDQYGNYSYNETTIDAGSDLPNSVCTIGASQAIYNNGTLTINIVINTPFPQTPHVYTIASDTWLENNWQDWGAWTPPQPSLTAPSNPAETVSPNGVPTSFAVPVSTQNFSGELSAGWVSYSYISLSGNPSNSYPIPSLTFEGLNVTSSGSVNLPASVFAAFNVPFGTYIFSCQVHNGSNTLSQPFYVTVTVSSNPQPYTITSSPVTGLTVQVDGVNYPTPTTFNWTPNSVHNLTGVTTAAGSGTQYAPASLPYQITANQTSFTVAFNAQYQLTTSANPSSGGTVMASPCAPSGGGVYWCNAGTSVAITASANTGNSFTSFTGCGLSGNNATQSCTMVGPQAVIANFTSTPQPDFQFPSTLSASGAAGTIAQVQATITPVAGFTGSVAVGHDSTSWPAPIFVAGTSSPVQLPAAVTLQIQIPYTTPAGVYYLTVTAGGGGVQHSATLTLTVSPHQQPHTTNNCSDPAQYYLTGISSVATNPSDLSTVYFYSSPELSPCAAAGNVYFGGWITYDLFTDPYFLTDEPNPGTLNDCGQGPNPQCEYYTPGVEDTWTASYSPTNGYDYVTSTDHYVVQNVLAGFDIYGDAVFEDPLGFSLLPASDPSIGSDSFDPEFSDIFTLEEVIYVGSTLAQTSTADQTPYITSITPNSWDAGSSVNVVIQGSNFGSGTPQLEVSGSGITISNVSVSAAGDAVYATFIIDPSAEQTDRTVDVVSQGVSGLGFASGPARQPTSNPVTFTVNGSPCKITIPNNGQKYTLGGADLRQLQLPLTTQSQNTSGGQCQGTVSWQLSFFYVGSHGQNQATAGPFTMTGNLNSTLTFTPPSGTVAGGRVDAKVTVTINGQSSQQAVTFYVDGANSGPVFKPFIASQYQSMHTAMIGTSTTEPNLFIGVGWKESNLSQFGNIKYCNSKGKTTPVTVALFGVAGQWPVENCASSAVGLGQYLGSQSSNVMPDAWDWQQNISDSMNLFLTDKWRRASIRETSFRTKYTTLPALSDAQREQCALAFYGAPAGKLSHNSQLNYWVPDIDPKTQTVRIVNGQGQWKITSDTTVTGYVNFVLSHMNQ
jgi:hypothetical protein